MHHLRNISDNLLYVGGIDRRLSRFENLFPVPQGVTYNSYLLRDEKNCLFDGVDKSIAELYYENIEAGLAGEKLDYLIVNHVEPDHCQTIRNVLELYPDAVLVTSKMALKFLNQFYPFDFTSRAQIVEEGYVLDTGKHQLEFIAAPNVHWPEVTMVYEQNNGWLFAADAFGSFKAFEGTIFADQTKWDQDWLAEYRRYYCNIVGRHGLNVQRVLKKFEGREIKLILPLHGLVFRPGRELDLALEKYQAWSTYTPEEAGTVIVYGSLYENSMNTADHLADQLAERGVQNIRVYDVSGTDFSYIIADLFRYSHACFVCNNYNTELYPKLDALLRELMMLNWQNHSVSIIGNGSWGGRGVQIAQEILGKSKQLEFVGQPLLTVGSLKEDQFDDLQLLADQIAAGIKEFDA